MASTQYVALYARVSSVAQSRRDTILSQVKALREFCDRLGYTVYHEYVDDGVSGTSLDRPALNALKVDAQAGRFGKIVCWQLDRLGRADAGAMLNLWRFFFDLNMPIIEGSSGTDYMENKLAFGLISLLAEGSNEIRREGTMRGKREKVLQGHFGGGVVAYGYRVDPIAGRLVVDEEQASFVRQMFRWSVVDGLGSVQVATRLNALGVPSQTRAAGDAERRGTSGRWSDSQVRGVLRNSMYAGRLVWGRRAKNRRSYDKPSFEVQCPSIVDDETWSLAQKAAQDRRRFKGPKSETKYPLRGLIRCGVCGRIWVGMTMKAHRYYRCGGVSHPSLEGKRCSAPAIQADMLELPIWETLLRALADPNNVSAYLANLREARIRPKAPRIENLSSKLRGLKRREDRLVNRLADAEPALAPAIERGLLGLAQEIQALKDERDKIDREIAYEQRREQIAASFESAVARILESLSEATPNQRMAVMQLLVAEIVVAEPSDFPLADNRRDDVTVRLRVRFGRNLDGTPRAAQSPYWPTTPFVRPMRSGRVPTK